MESPFRITVFDKTFDRKGILGNPLSQSYTVRFNAVGTGEFEVSATDPMLGFLYESGARVRVTYKGAHLMSGPVLHPSGDFNADGVVRFQVEDDYRILVNTLAWVSPAGPLTPTELTSTVPQSWAQAWLPGGGSDAGADGTTQGQFGYYLWPDGSAASGGVLVSTAEAAIKNVISRNVVTRLGRPVTVAADLARGGDARAAGVLPLVRFSPVDEVVAPLLDWSGLGLRLTHDGLAATITADVFVPTVHPQILTVQSGIIQAGVWEKENPTATRIVVGGPGEDVARAFWGVNSLPLETEFGDVVEVFRDATGANLQWPSTLSDLFHVAKYFLLRSEVSAGSKAVFTAYLNAAANKGLAEGAPKSGLSLTLSETESFFYGPGGYREGDIITAQSNGVNFTDRITECELSESVSAGVIVRPRVGGRADDPDTIFADAINRLSRAQRRLSTDK